jgi:transposase
VFGRRPRLGTFLNPVGLRQITAIPFYLLKLRLPVTSNEWLPARQLGEDVSEILERIPPSYKVIQHVRLKMTCTKCDVIVQAPAPSRRIERGLAGPALLAHVLVSRYADHCPLYRQSEIVARDGIDLDRYTLADWVGSASHLLSPLIDQIRKHVMAGSKLHADDTPVPVLASGMGKTKTARLWTYVRDDRPAGSDVPPAVWFAYSPDRKGEHPRQHLKDFRGVLQADAYAGFGHLYQAGHIQEAACMAHIRRKFYDSQVANGSPSRPRRFSALVSSTILSARSWEVGSGEAGNPSDPRSPCDG